ncbi:hypothetical protein BJX63DRAFT_349173 [Aspergillus granulosus]|uniref:Uncharacterized protein n=1 Tax=Aspergillus granulosus TaxID=176169 RepID=A0ABR4H2F4_9EURO
MRRKKFLNKHWNLCRSSDRRIEDGWIQCGMGIQIPGTTAATERSPPPHSQNNAGWPRPAMNCVRDECSWTDPGQPGGGRITPLPALKSTGRNVTSFHPSESPRHVIDHKQSERQPKRTLRSQLASEAWCESIHPSIWRSVNLSLCRGRAWPSFQMKMLRARLFWMHRISRKKWIGVFEPSPIIPTATVR